MFKKVWEYKKTTTIVQQLDESHQKLAHIKII